jgi:hypothetical protein
VRENDEKAVKKILSASKENVNLPDATGRFPLHIAAEVRVDSSFSVLLVQLRALLGGTSRDGEAAAGEEGGHQHQGQQWMDR